MRYADEYEEFLGEFWSQDEVVDAVSERQLDARESGRLTRLCEEMWPTYAEAAPYEPMPFSPASMPDLLDVALLSADESRDRDRERVLVGEVQDSSSSAALLELLAMYSNILNDAFTQAVRTHGSRVDEQVVRRAILLAFTEAVMEFDLASGPELSLFGGPGAKPITFRFAPAVRQAVADETLPVQVNGRIVSETLKPKKAATTERIPASQVKRIPNIGVLLESMGDTVTICGMVFTRAQLELAAEMAHAERVLYARFGRIEPGSLHDWAFGDLPDSNVPAWVNWISIIEHDAIGPVPAGSVSASVVDHDPVGEARMVTRSQRERIGSLLSVLTDRQADVVTAVFGVGRDPMTQEEYAKHNGISQQAVSKSLVAALVAMRKKANIKEEA